MSKVVITGMGAISAIGNNVEENYASLVAQKTGIGTMSILDSVHKHLPVGEVKLTNDELLQLLGNPKGNFTRTSLLGMVAAKEALEQSGINLLDGKRTGLISATTVGGMVTTENLFYDFLDDRKSGDFLEFIECHCCGDSTEKIADYLGVKDYLNTINTACSSSVNSIILGSRLIKHGIVDRVVAGGVDALSKFTVNGFNTLMILSDTVCRPFSNNRKGLNLGEGAGFVVLERAEDAKDKKVFSEVSGYANTCDAYHQTASSPNGEGAYLSMSQAVESAGLKLKDIDYINAHGTATEINDLSESNAVINLFGDNPPKISSTKTYTGHTLAACGGIEAVYCNLALEYQTIFPNLHFEEQMEDVNITPVTSLQQNESVKHVLSNGFGFGGNNSSVIFSKIEK